MSSNDEYMHISFCEIDKLNINEAIALLNNSDKLPDKEYVMLINRINSLRGMTPNEMYRNLKLD